MLNRRLFALTAFCSLMLPAAAVHAGEKIYTGILSSTAVGGYDPVAYFNKGQPVEGKSEFSAAHAGVNWYFETAANRDSFLANPAAYAPQYGGHCAWAAAQGYLAKGDPNNWKIVNGKLYLNYNEEVQQKWQADIPSFVASADKNWPSIGQE